MFEFRDLGKLTSIACALVVAHGACDFFTSGVEWFQGPSTNGEPRTADFLQLINFVVLIACMITVGRWIYRASVNAHALSSEMTISPGWSVGWYFVPFANLLKPYEAMRDIWLASHESTGAYDERVPIVRLWWGLWIATNIISWAAFRTADVGAGPTLYLLASVITLPLCAVLIIMMREIDGSQRHAHSAYTFA